MRTSVVRQGFGLEAGTELNLEGQVGCRPKSKILYDEEVKSARHLDQIQLSGALGSQSGPPLTTHMSCTGYPKNVRNKWSPGVSVRQRITTSSTRMSQP